ncbi:MAG: hypothetical protein RLZZ605_92 [Bacteroidota bacterium]|jgi:hypothetical protein
MASKIYSTEKKIRRRIYTNERIVNTYIQLGNTKQVAWQNVKMNDQITKLLSSYKFM